jgi:hypothetical protein
MVIKKVLFLIFFMITLFSLPAQAPFVTDPEYFVEMRFVQRLSWSGDEYATRYEVIVERETSAGIYRQVVQEFTTAFSIEVRLQAGRYRYQVFPYDFFDQRGIGSGWIDFEIFPAHFPELRYMQFEFDLTEYKEEYVIINKLTLYVYGNNIETRANIFLRLSGGRIITPDMINISNTRDNNMISLVFNPPFSIPEFFEIVVRNPGGLEASLIGTIRFPGNQYTGEIIVAAVPEEIEIEIEEIIIEEVQYQPRVRNPYVDYYFGIAFMPQLPLYGDINWLAEQDAALPGAAFRFAFVFNRLNFVRFGLEMSAGFYDMTINMGTNQSVTGDICLLLQRQLPGLNAAFTFRFGVGSVLNMRMIQTQNTWQSSHINTGISFLLLPSRSFYLELGLDLLFWLLNENIEQPEFASCYRPFFGIGFKF